MKIFQSPGSFSLYLVFALLFSLQVVPRIGWDSLTQDEPTDITNGYYYLTRGDVATPHNHPPLAGALQAWPLLFMHLKTFPFQGDVIDRGHYFLFDWNLDRLEAITWASRLMSWAIGLGIGFLLWAVLKGNPGWLFWALFFCTFEPIFSALSGLAKSDIAPTFFFFFSVLAFQNAVRKPFWGFSLAAGIISAMAVTCKFYCLVLIPLFAALEFFNEREHLKPQQITWKNLRQIRRRWIIGLAGFFLWILVLYLPGTLFQPDHRWPFAYFIDKFKEDLVFAGSSHVVFFLGHTGLQSHWYYFPVAFVLKEPLPFLFLLAVCVYLQITGRIVLSAWQWVSPLFFALAVLPAPNLGVRYLLPALPFLFLMGGKTASALWQSAKGQNAKAGKLLVGGLALWQVTSVLLSFPGAIGYFNDLVPDGKKISLLGDSNLDWGQDLKRLAAVAGARKWKRVKLAYLGSVDPKVYGLDWEPWSPADLKGPLAGTVYAVNSGFLQLAPLSYPTTRAIAESWIRQATLSGKVGDSWYFFEVPGQLSKDKEKNFLPSAPFLQYRGYVPYPPSGPAVQ